MYLLSHRLLPNILTIFVSYYNFMTNLMTKQANILALFVCIIVAVATTACGSKNDESSEKTEKTEKDDNVNWEVSVHRTRPIIVDNIPYEYCYVKDTAAVNERIRDLQIEGHTIGWTLPHDDGQLSLIAYENEPLMSEKVRIDEVTPEGNVVDVRFTFSDAEKWTEITRENIGNSLALFVNGQLVSTPWIADVIQGGKCSVVISKNLVKDFLPKRYLKASKAGKELRSAEDLIE